jgi:DNA-binding NarL/FixJ family response regulator
VKVFVDPTERSSLGRRFVPVGSRIMRLVFAEDSFIVREGVKALLQAIDGFDLVDVVEGPEELLASVDEHLPDVVLTDIRMPPTRTDEGIRAALEIRQRHQDIGVLVLSQYVEPDYALRLFESGTDGLGYLLKERIGDMDQLVDGIRRVADGGSVIDPKVVDALIEGRGMARRSKLSRLTDRELEVLEEVATGKSNAAIAEALFLSVRAIEKNINSIFTKLDLHPEPDVNRRVQAVLLYLTEQGA